MADERFKRLLGPVYAQALAFARHVSKSASDGDDLFQEALLRAMTKLDTLRDDAAFKPWLFRIAISVHRTRCRRAFWKRFVQTAAPLAEPDPATSGDYRVAEWSPDAAEAGRRARDALASLAPKYREAIALFEIEGWQVDELAALYGIRAGAVRSGRRAARESSRRRGRGGSFDRRNLPIGVRRLDDKYCDLLPRVAALEACGPRRLA